MSTMSGNQSTMSSFVVMIGLIMVAFLVALTLLGSGPSEVSKIQMQAVRQSPAPAIEWTGLGEHVSVPSGMIIKPHAGKHKDQVLDAWTIYAYLLEGNCVASAMFCGASDIERLYLCVDPTGRIGGLIVFGDEILTGYQANQNYWTTKVGKPEWQVCRD